MLTDILIINHFVLSFYQKRRTHGGREGGKGGREGGREGREGGREGREGGKGGREGREGRVRKVNTVQVVLDFQSNEFTSQFQTRSDRQLHSLVSAGFLM